MYNEIYLGKKLRVIGRSVESRKTIITFDHYVPGKCGFSAFKPTSWLCGNEFCEIRLQTRENDWFLNNDLYQALGSISEEISSQRIVICVGFSMGAFGALLAGSLLDATYIVAVSPQFFPLTRVQSRSRAQDASLRKDLRSLLPDGKRCRRGVILFDPEISRDRFHAEGIGSAFPNVEPVPLRGGGHPATKRLREIRRLGLLKGLVRDHSAGVRALREVNLN